MKNRTRALALAGSAALVATLVAAAPAPASPTGPKLASVHGGGTIFFPYSPEDDIRFTVDAESAPWSRPYPAPGPEKGLPTDARGRVTISHHYVQSGFTAVAEAEIDCLVTGGKTATLTAVVKSSNVGWDGKRIGISVQDGERGHPDRVGFSWAVANLDVKPDGTVDEGAVGTCMAPAPFTEVTKGGFKVTPAPLAPMP
uniref:Repetin n=1 Tax=Streptomyces sp. NBC_00049 TaxID=2903617 RepID=A0AAU2JVJ1_9ACTN